MTIALGPDLACDLPTLLATRMLIQANSGGGKSQTIRKLLEETHGQVQHLVIDPEGEFASLRERYDYVLAARHGGDTAADPRTAGLLAERLLELGVSAILDIYELKAHERVRFVHLFLDALMSAPKNLWHPVLVVIDESHLFCPEAGKSRGENPATAAVIDLATRGRKRGFCAVLATQRLSKLNKDAAAELNNVLIGRTGLDVDQKRAADVLGFTTREERLGLRDLAPGRFWAFGPALTSGVELVQVGKVHTSHPKVSGAQAVRVPPPSAAVKKLLPQLADLPAEVEERTRTVDDLKRDLANARRDITRLEKAQPATKVERVEVPAVKPAEVQRLEQAVAALAKAQEREQAALATVGTAIERIRDAANTIGAGLAWAGGTTRPEQRKAPTPLPVVHRADAVYDTVKRSQPVNKSAAVNKSDENGDLSGPEQRILDGLAWLEAIGVERPENAAVAFMAGYRPNGGAFQNPRGRLNQRGLIAYPQPGFVSLTDAGRAVARHPDQTPTTETLHRMVLDRLDGPMGRILTPLLAVYPDGLTNEALADAAGYAPTGGAFQNPRGRLRTLGLVEYVGGEVRARAILFPEGR